MPSASGTPAPVAISTAPVDLDPAALLTSLENDGEGPERMQTLPDVRELDENFDTAFQLAMNRGPLCAEPVIGMAYFVESVLLNDAELSIAQGTSSPIRVRDLIFSIVRSKWSNARGNMISAGQDVFRNGLLDWSPRLQLAMYSCDIQATGQLSLSALCADIDTGEVLGKVYGVIARRRGRIVSEEMKEGTAFFTISSLLPVVESFGFADGQSLPLHSTVLTRSLQKFAPRRLALQVPSWSSTGTSAPVRTLRADLPRYEILDQDPFWVPTTEEELEDLGDKADRDNVAKKYMESVRLRKVSSIISFPCHSFAMGGANFHIPTCCGRGRMLTLL